MRGKVVRVALGGRLGLGMGSRIGGQVNSLSLASAHARKPGKAFPPVKCRRRARCLVEATQHLPHQLGPVDLQREERPLERLPQNEGSNSLLQLQLTGDSMARWIRTPSQLARCPGNQLKNCRPFFAPLLILGLRLCKSCPLSLCFRWEGDGGQR
ncbi:hypothetical protein VTK26DRAFT_8402 [Humicola hyalothermophila]